MIPPLPVDSERSDVILTIGVFDGVHLGRRLCLITLNRCLTRLRRLGLALVTHLRLSPQLVWLSAFELMARICQYLWLRGLWVGYDLALGRRWEGTDHLADQPPPRLKPEADPSL